MGRSPGPTGRDEVVDALVRAAIGLFSEQGIRATSVRQIAEAAGVNHGLVHHYFGSKRALLEASLRQLAGAHAGLPVAGAGAPDGSEESRGSDGSDGSDDSGGDGGATGAGRTDGGGSDASGGTDSPVERHWRILAFALLEGEDPAELQESFPLFDSMVDARRRTGLDGRQARLEVARAVATGLGWQMFRQLIVTGLKLEGSDCDDIDRSILDLMA